MISRWNRFWFETNGISQMRLFRGLIGFLFLVCYCVRSIDIQLFFGPQGLLPPGAMADFLPMSHRFSVLDFFPSALGLYVVNGIFLTSLLLLALGVFPRLFAALALILHVSFIHRNIALTYGVDMIATLYLFYLSFASTDEKELGTPRGMLGSVAYRLCQIQICLIYAYSGLHKLQGVFWWKGDGVWNAVANFEIARFDFSWAAHFPAVLMAMSFTSLLWEIYFPALVAIKSTRYPALVFGALFHVGIGVAIGLPFFAALMIILYSLFLDAAHTEFLLNTSKSMMRQVLRSIVGNSPKNTQVRGGAAEEFIV